MRLFIAVDLKEIEEYFPKLQKDIPNESVSLAKSFHLTLKFLGEVREGDIGEIDKALSRIKFRPFSFNLHEIGFFPNERSIRVVWIGINPEEEIILLQKQIDESLKDFFNKEKDFKPHITLARTMHIGNPKEFVGQLKNIEIEPKKIYVREFKLMKSTLSRSGPVYEELRSYSS